MLRYIASLFLCTLLLTGCAREPVHDAQSSVAALSHLLTGLDPNIPKDEASHLAEDIFSYAAVLEKRFGREGDPYWHNFLINIGIKKRGLCYHYSDALYLHLRQGDYPHFAFHLLGTHIGEYWREHNALAVTAKGHPVMEGVVVDAWRERGRVFVSKIREDRAYRWVHRPDRGCR
jgi:hypothetical protein